MAKDMPPADAADTPALDAPLAAALGALPDAPLAVPRQVLEHPEGRLSRLWPRWPAWPRVPRLGN